MLVTEPNVVWLQVTVLVLAILFVTITLASDCFVKSFRAYAVFERSMEGVDTIQPDLLTGNMSG